MGKLFSKGSKQLYKEIIQSFKTYQQIVHQKRKSNTHNRMEFHK